jgi:hypothetical protein
LKLVTGHEKLVTGHDKKLNFLKTGHQINWSGWSGSGHDQTGHKSLKTRHLHDPSFLLLFRKQLQAALLFYPGYISPIKGPKNK